MTENDMIKLMNEGTKMILEGNLSDTPYNERMMSMAQASRNILALKGTYELSDHVPESHEISHLTECNCHINEENKFIYMSYYNSHDQKRENAYRPGKIKILG